MLCCWRDMLFPLSLSLPFSSVYSHVCAQPRNGLLCVLLGRCVPTYNLRDCGRAAGRILLQEARGKSHTHTHKSSPSLHRALACTHIKAQPNVTPCNRTQPKATEGNRRQPSATESNRRQSEANRCNRTLSLSRRAYVSSSSNAAVFAFWTGGQVHGAQSSMDRHSVPQLGFSVV